jgi:hypothetical protein
VNADLPIMGSDRGQLHACIIPCPGEKARGKKKKDFA